MLIYDRFWSEFICEGPNNQKDNGEDQIDKIAIC